MTLDYTGSENASTGVRFPEYVLRQLLGYALRRIRENLSDPVSLIDELFVNAGPEVISQVKAWLYEHPNIQCVTAWPREAVNLPIVAVINQGEQESTEHTFLGDTLGVAVFGPPESRRFRQRQSVTNRHVTNIYIATDDPATTLYLYNIVRYILFSNKLELLTHAGLDNLTIGGQQLDFDPDKFPIFAYYRMVQLNYLATFDYSLPEECAAIVSLSLMVQNGDYPEVEVETL